MKIGFDIDGILADFNASFIRRAVLVTGVDLFPPRPFDIPTWDYPAFYGYTKEQTTAIWDSIKGDPTFWSTLPSYDETWEVIQRLNACARLGHEVTYVTNRMGLLPKRQTESWLMTYNAERPTVLLSAKKGPVARALDFDVYIDDKWENCIDVAVVHEEVTIGGMTVPALFGKTRTYMLDRPWNRLGDESKFNIMRVSSATQMLNLEAPRLG